MVSLMVSRQWEVKLDFHVICAADYLGRRWEVEQGSG